MSLESVKGIRCAGDNQVEAALVLTSQMDPRTDQSRIRPKGGRRVYDLLDSGNNVIDSGAQNQFLKLIYEDDESRAFAAYGIQGTCNELTCVGYKFGVW